MSQGLFSSWRVWLLIIALLLSVVGIAFVGVTLGIDFDGGTSFQIKLASSTASPDEKEQIRSIIEQRLNFTGLRDATVTFIGNDVILADIAETNPKQVRQLESLLLRQGKFEATLDGNVLFTGADFKVIKDPAQGYGLRPSSDGGAEWSLPFLLSTKAGQRFAQMTFHQCDITGVDVSGQRSYDCKKTYFFIDRPAESVLVLSPSVLSEDQAIFQIGNRIADIPPETDLDELLLNASTPLVVLDSNADQNHWAATWQELESLKANHPIALVPESLSEDLQRQLREKGFEVKTVPVATGIPFAWQAVGGRSVISLTASVTNLEPYVADPKDAKAFSMLQIEGSASDQKDAQERLNSLTILLQSGSLPIAVDSISKETISPLLGQRFLDDALWMGVVALLVVVLIVFARYRRLELAIPLGFISISEVVIVLGFAAFVRWNLDLASMAGIIAAIGTGVNQQIIITDEMLSMGAKTETTSLTNRTKRALFIIIASAATVLATMVPIIIFSFGLGKLVGFAVTTTAGVLVGVLITRPAYSEFARYLIERRNKTE